MKALIVLIAILMRSGAVAQKVDEKVVPENVKAGLRKLHPNITKVKWSKEGGNYEAEFESKGETSLLIDESGNVLETEVEIEKKALPTEIFNYVKAKYKGRSIREAAKITDAKGVVTYEAEIKGGELLFDANGKFITEKKE